MSSITHSTGTEGPRHDPYGYNQLTVHRDGANDFPTKLRVTIHSGLALWCMVEYRYYTGNGQHKWAVMHNASHNSEKVLALFEQWAGVSYHHAERAYQTYQDRKFRRPACGEHCRGRYIESTDGFPGETLYQCTKCQLIVGTRFNRSVVE